MIAMPEHLTADGRLAALQDRIANDPEFAAQVEADMESREKAAAQELVQRRQEARARVYQRSRPARYASADLGGLHPQQDPGQKVTRWAGSGAQQLVLVGPSGHGKSHAAWAVANRAAADGLYVIGWNVTDLMDALARPDVHDRFDDTRSAERERIEGRVMDADLLLLDDLGAEDTVGWFKTLVYRIVDTRLGAGRRTIVTFNAATTEESGEVLTGRYGDRVRTRLYENAWWCWVQGESLRKGHPVPPFNEGGAL